MLFVGLLWCVSCLLASPVSASAPLVACSKRHLKLYSLGSPLASKLQQTNITIHYITSKWTTIVKNSLLFCALQFLAPGFIVIVLHYHSCYLLCIKGRIALNWEGGQMLCTFSPCSRHSARRCLPPHKDIYHSCHSAGRKPILF